jgi:hypothetical protein
MARKLEKTKPAAESPSAAETLATLSPDLAITIAGRAIVIREYGFFEGLAVAHRAAGFIADMHAMCQGDGDLRFDRIRRLFGVHEAAVVDIAAQSAGVEPEWIRTLNNDDADAFLSGWFGVNAGFFVREVIVEMREARTRQRLGLTGANSLLASPTPGSETSIASGAAPSGN